MPYTIQKTVSWVFVDLETGKGVYETYSASVAAKVNTKRYKAVPILEYLQNLNRRIKAGEGPKDGKI